MAVPFQNLALFGALLFFIGMKNSIPRRQLKKRSPKSKTLWKATFRCFEGLLSLGGLISGFCQDLVFVWGFPLLETRDLEEKEKENIFLLWLCDPICHSWSKLRFMSDTCLFSFAVDVLNHFEGGVGFH